MFSGCVFDFPSFSTSPSLFFATHSCLYKNERTALSECRRSDSLSDADPVGHAWTIVAVCLAAIVLMGMGFGICGILVCRLRRRRCDPSDSLSVESSPVYETEHLGAMTLYHETNETGWVGIHRDRKMRVGTADNLMFGKEIYFAMDPSETVRKARHKGVMLSARVDIGEAMILQDARNGRYHNFNPSILQRARCGGVKGQRCREAPWEYVVYDSWRVANIRLAFRSTVTL
jgi:hypothetical protein